MNIKQTTYRRNARVDIYLTKFNIRKIIFIALININIHF